MIVYVESNFVLELAYQQEQYKSCHGLLELAEAGDIKLVLPAFSISEPYESFVRRFTGRKQLLEHFEREVRELSRSEPYSALSGQSADLTDIITRARDEEKIRLDDTMLRLLRCAETIPVSADIMEHAIQLQKGAISSAQDAIVFASVARNLKSAKARESCFVNKNAGDFADPDVQEILEKHNCKLLARFPDGLGFVRSRLKSQS